MQSDIAERREKYKQPSLASKTFKNKDLLISRPSDMDYDMYKKLKSYQDKVIRELFKSKPSHRVMRMMKQTAPSEHLQSQVLKRRIFNDHVDTMKRAEVFKPSIFRKLFNFIRNGWTTRKSTTKS